MSHFDVGLTLVVSARVDAVTRGGFDYAEFRVDEKREPEDFPKRYGGLSGSGLWLLGETFRPSTLTTWSGEVSREGVIFYHEPDPPERLRGHGRRSIYQSLLGAL